MNYFVNQQYDPSSQTQESYNQLNSYLPQSYAYPNPQFTTTIHPYSYQQNPLAQPSQHHEQEPNPPGVSPPPPPPVPETYQNSYYQYTGHSTASAGVPTAGPQPVAVEAGAHTVAHQQIVQPLYGGVDPQTHLGPNPNVSSSPFLVNGVRALPVYGATPFQEQTVTAYGGLHFQGGPYQHPSQSYVELYHGPIPTPKVSGPVSRARGRGKGRQKHAVAPGQDPKLGASSFSQTQLLPSQALAPVLPPPKGVICELCKVECNTVEIFQQHANGKKHKKKLKAFEELRNLNKKVPSGQAEQTPPVELKPEVVPQPEHTVCSDTQQLQQEALPSQEINEEGTKVAGEKRKAGEVEPLEEPDKKMRVDGSENPRRGLKNKLKSGKSKRKKTKPSKGLVQAAKPKEFTPLVCELCNVKCESVVVFQSHLAGKKHISKAKSFLQGQGTFGQEQRPAIQAVDPSALSFISFQHAALGVSAQNVNTSSGQGDIMRSGEAEGVTATNLPASLVANS